MTFSTDHVVNTYRRCMYSNMTDATNVNFHKKRRRVTKASLTKLSSKLTELEADTTNPDALRAAQGLASKLKTLDAESKTHQLAIIDPTNDDDGLTTEQQELDDHDDHASELTIRTQRLISTLSPQQSMGLDQTPHTSSREVGYHSRSSWRNPRGSQRR